MQYSFMQADMKLQLDQLERQKKALIDEQDHAEQLMQEQQKRFIQEKRQKEEDLLKQQAALDNERYFGKTCCMRWYMCDVDCTSYIAISNFTPYTVCNYAINPICNLLCLPIIYLCILQRSKVKSHSFQDVRI